MEKTLNIDGRGAEICRPISREKAEESYLRQVMSVAKTC